MLQICEFLQGHLTGTMLEACRQPSYLTREDRSLEFAQDLEQDCWYRLIYTSNTGNIPCVLRLLSLIVIHIRKF